ncbi:hypothetical protein EON80_28900 [bacterium]|nr:MAG: hypothetical protein EON80_28900 [bacterium]
MALFPWMIVQMWRERKEAWERRHDQLTLNAEGLLFTSPTQTIQAKWDELETFTLLPNRGTIKPVLIGTAHGEFLLTSHRYHVWSLLQQYAPQVLEPVRQRAEQEQRKRGDLEGERGAWSGGEVGVGARRWSYQSRDTQFALQCASFVTLCAPLIFLAIWHVNYSGEIDAPAPVVWPQVVGTLLVSSLIVAGGWLWFSRAEILANEQGLEVRSPFYKPRRVAWESIENYGWDGWGEFVLASGRKVYFARVFKPVRVEELRELIERRGR